MSIWGNYLGRKWCFDKDVRIDIVSSHLRKAEPWENVMHVNFARHVVAASMAVALALSMNTALASDQKYLSDSSFSIERSADGVPVYVTARLPVDDLINRHGSPAFRCALRSRTKPTRYRHFGGLGRLVYRRCDGHVLRC